MANGGIYWDQTKRTGVVPDFVFPAIQRGRLRRLHDICRWDSADAGSNAEDNPVFAGGIPPGSYLQVVFGGEGDETLGGTAGQLWTLDRVGNRLTNFASLTSLGSTGFAYNITLPPGEGRYIAFSPTGAQVAGNGVHLEIWYVID